jgi:hypothetical protein
MPNEMDIMSALTALFLGLQQNMRQSKQDQLQGLSLMAQMPGAELTPAPNAEAAPWWQALMGAPAFRSGAGGMPVASVGGAPVTVKQYGRAENQAFLDDILKGLPGGAPTTASVGLATPGGIVETDNLAAAGAGSVAPLTATNMQARMQQFGKSAGAYGVTAEEFATDPGIKALLATPGRQNEAFHKRLLEMGKEKRARLKDERELAAARPEQLTKSYELLGRMLPQAKDDPSYQRVRAMLNGKIDPDVFADLPLTYDPVKIEQATQLSWTAAQQSEVQREVAKQRALLPGKIAEQQALMPGKLQETYQEGRIRSDQASEDLRTDLPYRNQQELQQFEAQEAIRQGYKQQEEEQKALRDSRITSKEQAKTVVDVRDKLNSEPLYVRFSAAKTGFSNVATGMQQGNGFGDLTMIFGLATLNDPNPSVVRQEDFRTAAQAQGWLQRFFGTKERFFEGDLLTPEGRKKVLDNATRLYRERIANFREEMEPVYGGALQKVGLTFEDVMPELAMQVRQGQGAGPMTQQGVDQELARVNAKLRAAGMPPVTRDEVLQSFQRRGIEVR